MAEQHEGRLDYSSGRGPRSVVVRFALTGDSVMIRLPEYHEALGYAADQPVCLHVDDGAGPTSRHTSVEVRGRARRADEVQLAPAAAEALGERWPDGVRTHQLLLPLTEVATLAEPDAG